MLKNFYLEYLEILDRRIKLPEESSRRLWSQQLGHRGHDEFEQMLSEHCPENWEILHDLNFNHAVGKTQIDSLLISPHAIYHFEVKNLVSPAEYRDGEWYNVGSGAVYRNYFTQMNRQQELLGQVLKSLQIKVPIVSKLILINENDTVLFKEDMQEYYLKRWQIKQYLQEIKRQSVAGQSRHAINPAQVARALVGATIPEFAKDTYPEAVLVNDVRKGVICEHCNANMNAGRHRYHMVCERCGKVEAKGRAVMRTICEVGVMNYEEELTIGMVKEFIAEPALENVIKRKLAKHFTVSGKGRGATYVNPKASLEKAFPHLKFRYDRLD